MDVSHKILWVNLRQIQYLQPILGHDTIISLLY